MQHSDERVVLVTGGTSGIGRATALRLCRDGWRVVAVGREQADATSVTAELESVGNGYALAVDLADRGAGRALVERVVAQSGRLDAVVHAAGIHALGTVDDMSADTFDLLWRVNVASAFDIVGAAVTQMKRSGGGTIVLVASEAGHVAVPRQPAYNMTKAAILMLGKSIAVDHSGDGIRSVTVSPGTTRTPLVAQAIASAEDPIAHEHQLAHSRPAMRLGRVDEVVATIVFALSDDVGFLTGADIAIDGGFTAQ